jgi:hypothetical protein
VTSIKQRIEPEGERESSSSLSVGGGDARRWRRHRQQWQHREPGVLGLHLAATSSSIIPLVPPSGTSRSSSRASEPPAASGQNPSRRRSRCGVQRKRGAEQSAWRGRSGGDGPVETGDGGGRHQSRRSAARASPVVARTRQREERRGLGHRSVWPTVRSDRSGPVLTSRPTKPVGLWPISQQTLA